MSKESEINVCDNVMHCINERNLKPRPAWCYIISSTLLLIGLTALFIHASLLLHRIVFFSLDQGPLLTDMDKKWKMLFIVISIPAAAWSFFMGSQMVRRHSVFYRYHPYISLLALAVVSMIAVLVVEYTPLRDMII